MTFFLNRIKEPKTTQVIAKNLTLDELLNVEVLKELKQKFSGDVDIIPSALRFQVVPRQKELQTELNKSPKKEGVQIVFGPADFVSLEHPSPAHFSQKVIVITSNKSAILDKFLE